MTYDLIIDKRSGLLAIADKRGRNKVAYLLDSGSSATLVHIKIAPKGYEKYSRIGFGEGVGGQTTELWCKMPLTLLGITIKEFFIPNPELFERLSKTNSGFGLPVVAILGQSIFSQYEKVIFDYNRKTITFEGHNGKRTLASPTPPSDKAA